MGNKLDLVGRGPQDYVDSIDAEKMVQKLGAEGGLQCSALREIKQASGNVQDVFGTAINIGLDHLESLRNPILRSCLRSCILF